MAGLPVETYRLARQLRSHTRATIRREVIGWFLDERPGTGLKRTRYEYAVEDFGQGGQVLICRPAMLNKGSDFTVVATAWLRYRNGKPKPPSHADVVALARELVGAGAGRDALRSAVELVHSGNLVDPAVNLLPTNLVTPRMSMLLGVVKWLFIEQDVTYWNYSGRDRLMSHLREEL